LTGSGMVTITNSNNFTGDTTISGGTLQLGTGVSGQDGVIASSVVINNSVLLYNLAGSQAPGYTISGTGSLIKAGSGTLTLNNYQGYSGGTIVNGGTLGLNAGGYSGTVRGTLTINPGAVVKLNASDALGYGSGNCVTNVNINNGTIDNTTGGNNAFITNFALAGGTMSSSGGGTYNFATGYGITTNANTATSLISSGITIRDDNGANDMAFNVASGSTASGIDLAVSGKIAGGADCPGAQTVASLSRERASWP
jgi:autotransporter-associated beta strand protein